MSRMYRQIARLHDAGQHAPHIAVHREPETRLVQQGLQVVLVGHRDGLVCRIHPLHRQLQRLPAPHRAHRRGGGEHFLGLDGSKRKHGIFRFGGKIGEVGHGKAPFNLSHEKSYDIVSVKLIESASFAISILTVSNKSDIAINDVPENRS